jgi:hypothetical protein
MQALAGRLPHRGSNTDGERSAAEYIRSRFSDNTPNTEMDDFYSVDSPWMLFGAYYVEFVFVSLIATWWPRFALCYGGAVFLAYIAEFLGYDVMTRFTPQYETQNVIARFLSTKPSKLLVVMAHYDTAKRGPLDHPALRPWSRTLHTLMLVCMSIVLFSCAAEAMGFFQDSSIPYDAYARWFSAGMLAAAGIVIFINNAHSEYERGANDNASGVAALLKLSDVLAKDPIPDADVMLIATGSSWTWMSGARHFIITHKPGKDATYFINIDGVGRGELRYVSTEGLLNSQHADPEIIETAERLSAAHGASPCVMRLACSDGLLALTRGFKAMTITAEPQQGVKQDVADALSEIDYAAVSRAASFAEALLRDLGSRSQSQNS